jgi:hypothetical protein
VAPGLLDRYLARNGYDAQQMPDRPVPPDRPDNLCAPVAGDHGAHGIFDDRSKTRSAQWWLTTHRRAVALGAVAAGGAALVGVVRRR